MDWFAEQLLDWYGAHGRKDLPWQTDRTPYRVWLAEIMLQQTQVATVIPYYQAFVKRFPSIATLAAASEDEVLQLWTGLGYYRRARMLFQTARQIQSKYGGRFPSSLEKLVELPGIGRSTAGAILACAFGISAPILDGNVKRVLSRFHAVEGPRNKSAIERTLWMFAELHTPAESVASYTQAIMDLGAGICTRSNPKCDMCPVSLRCEARMTDSVSSYPSKPQNRPKREKTVRLLLILDKFNRCLVQKRPETGIWASLWSPPELESDQDIESALVELGIPSKLEMIKLENICFVHTLSHMRLTVKATTIRYGTEFEPRITSHGLRWYSASENTQLGVSAMTLKLLDAVTR